MASASAKKPRVQKSSARVHSAMGTCSNVLGPEEAGHNVGKRNNRTQAKRQRDNVMALAEWERRRRGEAGHVERLDINSIGQPKNMWQPTGMGVLDGCTSGRMAQRPASPVPPRELWPPIRPVKEVAI